MLNTQLGSKAPVIALILITFIWGGTFLAVKYALNYSSPMFFVGCRFACAATIIGLFSYQHLKHITRQDLWAGALIGCMVTIGYGTQTVGLQTVSSSESAFLTALYVPLVPVLLWLIFRKVPHFMIWIGALCAFMGLVLLTGNSLNSISLNFGQTLTLLGAIAIAMEIILIGYFAPTPHSRLFMAFTEYRTRLGSCQCRYSICNELGTALSQSISSSDYLRRRACMGSTVWASCRRTLSTTGFVGRTFSGVWHYDQ